MSARQLRARLTKLERAVKPSDPIIGTIDPIYGVVIYPDAEASEALYSSMGQSEINSAKLIERAKAIKCPPSYGFKEYWEDESLFRNFDTKYNDLCEAELRMEVFKNSPEGQARLRIHELDKSGRLDQAEYEEMIQLLKIYPEGWNNPKWGIPAGMCPEYLKKRTERDQIVLRRREEERRRNKIGQENKK